MVLGRLRPAFGPLTTAISAHPASVVRAEWGGQGRTAAEMQAEMPQAGRGQYHRGAWMARRYSVSATRPGAVVEAGAHAPEPRRQARRRWARRIKRQTQVPRMCSLTVWSSIGAISRHHPPPSGQGEHVDREGPVQQVSPCVLARPDVASALRRRTWRRRRLYPQRSFPHPTL